MVKKKKKSPSILPVIAVVLLALVVAAVSLVIAYLGKVNQGSDLSGDIGINSDLPSDGVQNIALFGLETEYRNNASGRSDAIIILSVDRTHNKIKLTSIARDTLVAVEGHGYKKLTEAWAYGGMSLAVKTINENFQMNITDYVYVNFFEFAELINYIGGVEVDVSAAEMQVMNSEYVSWIQAGGIDCAPITQPGFQRLSGGQALAYARNRYTGTDIDRGNRQKEVLEAMFTQMKDTPKTKFPGIVRRILEMCHTNLSNGEMLGMATWAVTKNPTFVQFSLPSAECHAEMGDRGDGYGDVVRYDMAVASRVLHAFIYEPTSTSTTAE